MRAISILYQNTRSRVRINNSYNDVFKAQVGFHQGSVPSPLLFIIVVEVLSPESQTGCPWELLYAGDLVMIPDTMDELLYKLD